MIKKNKSDYANLCISMIMNFFFPFMITWGLQLTPWICVMISLIIAIPTGYFTYRAWNSLFLVHKVETGLQLHHSFVLAIRFTKKNKGKILVRDYSGHIIKSQISYGNIGLNRFRVIFSFRAEENILYFNEMPEIKIIPFGIPIVSSKAKQIKEELKELAENFEPIE